MEVLQLPCKQVSFEKLFSLLATMGRIPSFHTSWYFEYFENKPEGRNFRINKSLQNSQRILLLSFYSLVQIMLLLFYPMEFSCVVPRCSELSFQNGHYSQWTDKHPVMIILVLQCIMYACAGYLLCVCIYICVYIYVYKYNVRVCVCIYIYVCVCVCMYYHTAFSSLWDLIFLYKDLYIYIDR